MYTTVAKEFLYMQTTIYSYKKPFLLGVLVAIFVLGVNAFAEYFHIYYLYHWFDIPMHISGGFAVGLIAIALLRVIYVGVAYEKKIQFVFMLALTILVGIAWEAFETYFKTSVMYGGNYWFDTIKDLLMDTLGGILSYICFHPHIKK